MLHSIITSTCFYKCLKNSSNTSNSFAKIYNVMIKPYFEYCSTITFLSQNQFKKKDYKNYKIGE